MLTIAPAVGRIWGRWAAMAGQEMPGVAVSVEWLMPEIGSYQRRCIGPALALSLAMHCLPAIPPASVPVAASGGAPGGGPVSTAALQGRFNAAIAQVLAERGPAQMGTAAPAAAGLPASSQADAVPGQAAQELPIAPLPEPGDPSDVPRPERNHGTAAIPQGANPAAATPPEQATLVSHLRGSGTASKQRNRPSDGSTIVNPPVTGPIAAAIAAVSPNEPATSSAASKIERSSSVSVAGHGARTQGVALEDSPPDAGNNGKAAPAATAPADSEPPSATPPDIQPRPVAKLTHTGLAAAREPSVPTEPQAATLQPSNPAPSAQTAAAKTETAPAPASPAAQLAPVLVSVVRTPHGAQHLTVRLEPAELGQVEVRVDRTAGAPVRVDVTVQRPETLTLLLRDQPQLQRALDQAGLPADGRSVAFHIAAPAPAIAALPHSSAVPNPLAGGGSGGGTYSGAGGHHSGAPRGTATADAKTPDDTQPVLVRWLRAGIDITA